MPAHHTIVRAGMTSPEASAMAVEVDGGHLGPEPRLDPERGERLANDRARVFPRSLLRQPD